MSRIGTFNSPFLLGFEYLERLLERTAESAGDAYPPYNIEERGPEGLRITLAVAGFERDELAVTVQENQLVIRGRQSENSNKTFLHRGIAARQFQRPFVLADGVAVTAATLRDGLLAIDLVRPKTDTAIRSIEIMSAGAGL